MMKLRYTAFPLMLLFICFQGFSQIGQVNKTIQLHDGFQPSSICCDGTNMWAIDYSTDLIYKLDATSGEILNSFYAPDMFPTGLAWDGEYLWCSGNRKREIFQLNTSGEIIKSIEVEGAPRGITFANGSIWYADSGGKIIREIDPESGEIVSTIPAPGGASRGLTFDGKYLWCSDKTLQEVYQKAIAEKFMYDKKLIIKELNKNGILGMLTKPESLSTNLINKYLELKNVGMI